MYICLCVCVCVYTHTHTHTHTHFIYPFLCSPELGLQQQNIFKALKVNLNRNKNNKRRQNIGNLLCLISWKSKISKFY